MDARIYWGRRFNWGGGRCTRKGGKSMEGGGGGAPLNRLKFSGKLQPKFFHTPRLHA